MKVEFVRIFLDAKIKLSIFQIYIQFLTNKLKHRLLKLTLEK